MINNNRSHDIPMINNHHTSRGTAIGCSYHIGPMHWQPATFMKGHHMHGCNVGAMTRQLQQHRHVGRNRMSFVGLFSSHLWDLFPVVFCFRSCFCFCFYFCFCFCFCFCFLCCFCFWFCFYFCFSFCSSEATYCHTSFDSYRRYLRLRVYGKIQ